MDDFSAKLSEILNDPQSMEKVRRMAENLLGEEDSPTEQPETPAGLDPAQLSKVMSILGRLNAGGNDARSNLLVALRPHLSPERQAKLDTALKLLRLIDLLPYLKESGILEL